MDTVALAAREGADLLLLVGPRESELRAIGPRIHLAPAQPEHLLAAADRLVRRRLPGKRVARLLDVRDLDGVAYPQGPRVRALGPGDQPQERGLSRAVRAYDAHDGAGRKRKGQVLEYQVLPVRLRDALSLHHERAQPRARGDDYLEFPLLLFHRFSQHRLVRGDAGLRLDAAGRG